MLRTVTAVALVAALCWGASEASGPAAFEGVDVSAMLQNETAVAGYVKCILGTGECNESAKRLQGQYGRTVEHALVETQVCECRSLVSV